MKVRKPIILSFAVLGIGALAWCGYKLLSDDDKPDDPFVPTLAVGAVVSVNDYRLTGPYSHDNLTIFLVHGRETLESTQFLTLEEALHEQKAIVNETGSVGQLTIENQSDSEIFIQSGDIVKGGKQDRTLPYDSIIEVKSAQVPIDSFCVEQGRWSKRGEESSMKFSSSSSSLSTSGLKRAAKSKKSSSQAEVWKNVARTQERLSRKLGETVKSDASASSLQLTLESPAVREAITPYKALVSIINQQNDVIGCVAVVNNHVVSADIYASRTLFRKLWPKLLDGSAVEAFIESGANRLGNPVNEDAVRTLLKDAENGKASGEAVTHRTYVQIRNGERASLFESCDRSRDNLVLHRSFLARKAE